VRADGWHWDSPAAWHRKSLEGLFVVSFIGAVAPRAGGTLVISVPLACWRATRPG